MSRAARVCGSRARLVARIAPVHNRVALAAAPPSLRFTGWLAEYDKDTKRIIIMLYYTFTSLAIGFCLLTCIICTALNVRGPGLALRGPEGSLKRAVDTMRKCVTRRPPSSRRRRHAERRATSRSGASCAGASRARASHMRSRASQRGNTLELLARARCFAFSSKLRHFIRSTPNVSKVGRCAWACRALTSCWVGVRLCLGGFARVSLRAVGVVRRTRRRAARRRRAVRHAAAAPAARLHGRRAIPRGAVRGRLARGARARQVPEAR